MGRSGPVLPNVQKQALESPRWSLTRISPITSLREAHSCAEVFPYILLVIGATKDEFKAVTVPWLPAGGVSTMGVMPHAEFGKLLQ